MKNDLIHLVPGSGGRWIIAWRTGMSKGNGTWATSCRKGNIVGFTAIFGDSFETLIKLGAATFASYQGACRRVRLQNKKTGEAFPSGRGAQA